MRVTWFHQGHLEGVIALVQAVVAADGAVGWLEVPSDDEVRTWVTGFARVAQVAVVEDEGAVQGIGGWCRFDAPVLKGLGEIRKVMTHPQGRGAGVGRLLVQALVEDATAAGMEVLTLDCRGNNHGAQRLYASLGFVVTGRRPDVIAVGGERFDQVLMHRDLRHGGDDLIRHGSRREGPGVT